MNIEVKNLTKKYDSKIVISSLSTTFYEGQTTCIMGKSGCGKTTLLYLLMNLIKPDLGSIEGVPTKYLSAVFQENRLLEDLSAVKNIFITRNKNITKQQIIHHLALVGLKEESIFQPVSKLSGGMKRRVAIVRAIMAPSKLIIMDEPFKGLDETTKKDVIHYIKTFTKGKTVLITTHDKEDVVLLGAHLFEL